MLAEQRKNNVYRINNYHSENFNYINTCLIKETKSDYFQKDSIEELQINYQLKTIHEENEYFKKTSLDSLKLSKSLFSND